MIWGVDMMMDTNNSLDMMHSRHSLGAMTHHHAVIFEEGMMRMMVERYDGFHADFLTKPVGEIHCLGTHTATTTSATRAHWLHLSKFEPMIAIFKLGWTRKWDPVGFVGALGVILSILGV